MPAAAFALGLLLGFGCEKSEPAPSAEKKESAAAEAPKAPEAAPAAKPAASHDELHAILAKADAADGKEDHVVSKCAGCGLGMDGKAEFAATAHDYTIYFCSAECKEHGTEDMDKTIMALGDAGDVN